MLITYIGVYLTASMIPPKVMKQLLEFYDAMHLYGLDPNHLAKVNRPIRFFKIR